MFFIFSVIFQSTQNSRHTKTRKSFEEMLVLLLLLTKFVAMKDDYLHQRHKGLVRCTKQTQPKTHSGMGTQGTNKSSKQKKQESERIMIGRWR